MISKTNTRIRIFFVALTPTLLVPFAFGQDPASAPEPVTAPITVRASSVTADVATKQFLAGFITTSARLTGAKFIGCVSTAVKTRPDLSAKVVVCALNISRLNSPSSDGRLSFVVIDQIVKAAVVAAPQSALDIVKAAINSEPYARACIVAAAIESAPSQAAEIQTIAALTASAPMVAAIASPINPVNNGGLGPVTSPEQPPVAP